MCAMIQKLRMNFGSMDFGYRFRFATAFIFFSSRQEPHASRSQDPRLRKTVPYDSSVCHKSERDAARSAGCSFRLYAFAGRPLAEVRVCELATPFRDVLLTASVRCGAFARLALAVYSWTRAFAPRVAHDPARNF